MKLNLPKNLKSALLSAVLAASATAPSFAEVAPWSIPYDEGQNYATVGSDSPLEFTLNQQWNTDWSIVFSVEASSLRNLAGNLTLLGLVMKDYNASKNQTTYYLAEGATMSGSNLTLSTFGKTDITQSINVPEGAGNITFVLSRSGTDRNNLSLTVYNSTNFDEALLTVESTAAQSFGNGTLTKVSFGKQPSDDGLNIQANFPTDNLGSYNITKAGYSLGSVATAADLRAFYGASTLTWAGGAEGNWSDSSWAAGGASGASFQENDSVIFATDNATITLASNVQAGEAEVQENTNFALAGNTLGILNLVLTDNKSLSVASNVPGGTLQVDTLHTGNGSMLNLGSNVALTVSHLDLEGRTLTVSGESEAMAITNLKGSGGTLNLGFGKDRKLQVETLALNAGETLTVTGGGTLAIADNISGVSINAENASSVEFKGTQIVNSTIKGNLILSHNNSRITVVGKVTLDSVVNDAGNTDYLFVGNNVTLTFTGTSDLTQTSDKRANANNKIGLNSASTLIIDSRASLTTSAIYHSTLEADATTHVANNGSLQVKEGGQLTLTDTSSNYSNATKFKALNNAGTITAAGIIGVYEGISNTGTITATELKITNYNNSTSSLGGTVDVDKLTLAGGTTTVAGTVKAGSVDASGTGITLSGTNAGTLVIDGSANSTANATLNGSFGINKTGSGMQTFSGNTSGYSGALNVSGGTLNLAQMGESSSVTQITLSGGATLGLYKESTTGDKAEVTFGGNGKLTVGENGGALNANVVLNGGSTLALNGTLDLGGALTLNGTALSGLLLENLLNGKQGSAILFRGVESLTIGGTTYTGVHEFSEEEVQSFFSSASAEEVSLLADTGSGVAAPAVQVKYADGAITMTSSVPEPATATLSLLALAALAARRRRK